jgi:hypothetical protein
MWHRRVGLISLSGMLAVAGLALLVAAPVVAGDPCYHGFEMPARTVDTDPQVSWRRARSCRR